MLRLTVIERPFDSKTKAFLNGIASGGMLVD